MGIRQRVVRQTVTELICDLCKRDIPADSARIGTLALRTPGQRGRASEAQVAFHAACASKIVDTAVKRAKPTTGAKPPGRKRGRPAAKAARAASKRTVGSGTKPPAKKK